MQDQEQPQDELGKLAGMVEAEARRAEWQARDRSDLELTAQGWERRFVTDSLRLQEVIELYERLGFEVRIEEFSAEEWSEDCEGCELVGLQKFRTVYTRRLQE